MGAYPTRHAWRQQRPPPCRSRLVQLGPVSSRLVPRRKVGLVHQRVGFPPRTFGSAGRQDLVPGPFGRRARLFCGTRR
eukprot:618307-Prymnesium_polylepis.1